MTALVAEAEAILQSIIRFQLRAWPHDLEDLYQEARLQLWQRMQVVQDLPKDLPEEAGATSPRPLPILALIRGIPIW